MMNGFCESANLKAYISELSPIPHMQEFLNLMQKIAGLDYSGVLLNDAPSAGLVGWTSETWGKNVSTPLTLTQAAAVRDRGQEPYSIRKLHCAGATYEAVRPESADLWTANRNSSILFYDQGRISAGRIVQIVGWKRASAEQSAIFVQPYQMLTREDAMADPYRSVKNLGAFLTYKDLSSDVKVVRTADIVGHVARAPYRPSEEPSILQPSRPCIVLVSLDRVSSTTVLPLVAHTSAQS